MSKPILRHADFAIGKYASFCMSNDGKSFSGNMHPGKVAYEVNPSKELDNEHRYIVARGSKVRGRTGGFIAAKTTSSIYKLPPNSHIDAEFTLVLNINVTKTRPSIITFYYLKWKGNLHPYSSMNEAMIPEHKELKHKYIKPPAKVKNIPEHSTTMCCDEVGKASGTKHIMQVDGKIALLFTTRTDAINNGDQYEWMPLPNCPDGQQHFALLMPEQRDTVDKYMYDKGAGYTMHPDTFRQWMEKYSEVNTGMRYVKMKNMKCGEEVNGVGSIDYWIVSCVTEDEIKELSKKSDLPISPTMCINFIDRNIQDPHIPGVVVFRGSRYIKNKGLGQDHINLLFSTILNGGQKRDCQNVKRGSFMNTDRRQTHMASGSMGEVSSSTDHQHCNVKEVEMSLKPFIRGITGHAGAQATQQQDVSGQVGIGTVKQAFKKNMKVDHLESSGVCPYNLVTVPRPITFYKSKKRKRKRNEQYNESYNNTDHLDSNDCTDEEIGGMVRQYLEDCDSPKLVAYFDRQFKLFEDRLSNDKTEKSNKRYKYPLPTTCAWQLIETPEEYSFRHIQSFIIQGAGVSWDISSDVLADSNIVSGTFYGLLVRHLTSCSLYEEISSGGVTTIMPGMAANAAWGSSGGWKYLKTTGRERQQLVLSLLERHREEHNGALPRSLPQVDIRNYTVTSRSGRVLGLTLPSEAEVATVGRGATAVGRGRGRARSNASRRGAAARRRGRTR